MNMAEFVGITVEMVYEAESAYMERSRLQTAEKWKSIGIEERLGWIQFVRRKKEIDKAAMAKDTVRTHDCTQSR